MNIQLRLWGGGTVDIGAKIRAEKEAKVQVFYHFCGEPLPMYKPGSALMGR